MTHFDETERPASCTLEEFGVAESLKEVNTYRSRCGIDYLGVECHCEYGPVNTIQAGLESDYLQALAAMGLLSVFLFERLWEI